MNAGECFTVEVVRLMNVNVKAIDNLHLMTALYATNIQSIGDEYTKEMMKEFEKYSLNKEEKDKLMKEVNKVYPSNKFGKNTLIGMHSILNSIQGWRVFKWAKDNKLNFFPFSAWGCYTKGSFRSYFKLLSAVRRFLLMPTTAEGVHFFVSCWVRIRIMMEQEYDKCM